MPTSIDSSCFFTSRSHSRPLMSRIRISLLSPATQAQPVGSNMVAFWAEWCVPGRVIAPLFWELVRDSAGRISLAKFILDDTHGLANRYAIRSIPKVLSVRQAQVVGPLIGAVP